MLIEFLTIKIAFIYTSERLHIIHGSKYAPTYRVSVGIYPEVTKPKFTAAVSEVKKDGTIFNPVIFYRSR